MMATATALREVERLARELDSFRPALARTPVYAHLCGASLSLDDSLHNLRLALVALDLARNVDYEKALAWHAAADPSKVAP